MKKILYSMLAVVMMLTTLAACSDEEVVKGGGGTVLPNGDVVLKVDANIPAPRQVVTRDIDPDGLGVNTLYLFCFDDFGAYIGRRDASARWPPLTLRDIIRLPWKCPARPALSTSSPISISTT